MQHTGLVLALEKSALQAVRADLMARQAKAVASTRGSSANHQNKSNGSNLGNHQLTKQQSITNLNFSNNHGNVDDNANNHHMEEVQVLNEVNFIDFAITLLQNMNCIPFEKKSEYQNYTSSNGFFLQLASIISVFEAVDVDSRGVIDFQDFTNFCLRLARLLFKPDIKRSSSTYLQNHDNSVSFFPSHGMRFISYCQALVVFDSETPRVRVYGRDGKYIGKINPILEAKRALRAKAALSTLTYRDRSIADKEAAQTRATERELDGLKGNILDSAFIDSTRQAVFSCTHSYLIFVDVSKGLMQENDTISVVAHVKTKNPLHGLYYSKVLDILLAYPGEGSDHDIEIYDPRTRQTRFVLHKHESKILAICEVILDKAHPQKDHFFVTSSINKKLLMWPSAPISALMKQSNAKKMLRIADTMDYELRGHNHAIHSLVYAPVREMLFGCGFDFDIIGWDPFSRDVCMRFVGHFKSMAGLQVVYVPSEKLLSIDEMGVMKLWNISKELGIYGEQESSVAVQCAQPPHIKDFTKTFDGGKTVAVLSEKVYFLSIEGDLLDDLKPVHSGIGISALSGRLFTVFRSTIQIFDIVTAMKVKRIAFLDADRISTGDQIISKNDDMKMGSLIPSSQQNVTPGLMGNHSPRGPVEINLKSLGGIDSKDKITAMAVDCKGKKVFLGTNDGRVLLYDSYTFGLLKQLTCETEDIAFNEQGSVVAMTYVDRDELVVAVYSNGAVKVFGGCQHGGYIAQKASNMHFDPRSQLDSDETGCSSSGDKSYPRARGGRAPSRPYLLRECDLGAIVDLSVRAMAVSVAHSLIAVLTKSGLVYLYDYLTMEFLQCIAMEDETAQRGTSIQYVGIQFLPYVPILLVVNSLHRVIAWTVKAMGYRHLLSWNIYSDVTYNQGAHKFFEGYNVETLDYNGKIDASLRTQEENDDNNSTKRHEDEDAEEAKDQFKAATAKDNHNNADKDLDEEKELDETTKANNPFFRFYPNMKASVTSFRCYTFPSPMADDDYKHLKPGKVNQYYRFVLLFGNEVGQFYTQNITEMVIQSTAFDFVPKLDAQLAVYQKLKPKRYEGIAEYDYDTSYARVRIPDDWANKIANPLRIEVETSTTSSFIASYSTSGKTKSSFILPSTNSGKGSSSNTSSSAGAMIPPQAFKLTRSQTRKNLRAGKKRLKLDQRIDTYVQGLYAWVAYSQVSILGIDFYNPNINYATDTFIPLDGLFEHFPHHNKLPMIVTMSENGTVRIWTFGGVYLGQTFDDGADEESTDKVVQEGGNTATGTSKNDGDFLNQVEGVIKETSNKDDKKAKKSAFDEEAMIESTTFITSLISDTQTKGPNREEEETISSKVFVKSETRPVIMTRRLSVVPKNLSLTKRDSKSLTSASSSSNNLGIHRTGSNQLNGLNTAIKALFEFTQITRKVFGSKGWLLPLATITLPSLKKGSDIFAVQPITRFSALQFSYIQMIWQWLVPHVKKEIDLFFQQKLEMEENRESSELNQKRKLFNLPKNSSSNTQQQGLQSSENLLKGMNSFFIDKQHIEGEGIKAGAGIGVDGSRPKSSTTTKKSKTQKTLDQMLEDIDRDHDPERFFEKIVGAMSDRELELVAALQAQCQDKFDKRNLNHLIDYIQDSESFPSAAKQGNSQALTFKNYEKEKQRNQRMIRIISQDVQEMIDSMISKEKSSTTVGKGVSADIATLNPAVDGGIATSSVAKIVVEGELKATVEIPPAMQQLMLPESLNSNGDPLKSPHIGKKKNQKLTESFSSASFDQTRLSIQLPSVQRVPSYGVIDEDLQDVKKISDVEMLDAFVNNRPVERPRTASSAIGGGRGSRPNMNHTSVSASQPNSFTQRPKSAQMARSDGFQWANNTAAIENADNLRHSKSELRINTIIGKLESIDIDDEHDAHIAPVRSMQDLIMSRPSTAPAIISSDREIDLFCDESNHPISLLGRTSVPEDTFSNYYRLTEITTRVQQAIATDKQGEKTTFRLYDPLYKKKMMIMLRNRRKMKQKLSFAKDKDKYIDEEDYHQHFEDVVDMEKELKKQQNKEMLKQAQAMGNKDSFYGPYKLPELVKFLHFLELLTPIELSHKERNAITYYDDSGIVELTKFMKDQHYYQVVDVIEVVFKLMGNSHPLIDQLMFFREQAPASERINVYQLIGLVFRLSKSLGIQLRIFLFVTAAHFMYDLMRSATMPKEFKPAGSTNGPGPVPNTITAGSFANLPTGQHGKKVNHLPPKATSGSGSAILGSKSKDENDFHKQKEKATNKNYSNLLADKAPDADNNDERRKSLRFHDSSVLSSSAGLEQSTMEPSQPASTVLTSPVTPRGNTNSGSRFKHNLHSKIERDKAINQETSLDVTLHEKSGAMDDTLGMEHSTVDIGGNLDRSTYSAMPTQGLPPLEPPEPPASTGVLNLQTIAEGSNVESVETEGHNLKEALSGIVSKFIVKPHPTRGFYNWVIKRKIFQKVTKIFDMWCDENLECLNVQDFIAIIQSLVPKNQVDNFRVMKTLPLTMTRIGLKMSAELNGENMYRIFEHVLQMKIVSG